MSAIDWNHFKSGTDIRGCACEGGPEPLDLTDAAVTAMTAAFAVWLSRRVGRPADAFTVAVGHDSRISAPRLRAAVVGALQRAGVHVLDCGLSSTPAMFMTTVDLHCDAAVQLTASHHPWYRNGLKFFTPEGGLEGTDITAILQLAAEGAVPPPAEGRVEPVAYMTAYAARLRRMICEGVQADDYDHPLRGLRIAVDAGNGAGGFYAEDVLVPLGADITGSRYLEPDGTFPHHIPNPENAEAMAAACEATVAAGADLGVIFDTDVDRAGCVAADGKEINRNRLVALAAVLALETAPGGTVVTDSVTSYGLKVFIEQTLGGKHRRFKRGYKNVIDEALRLESRGVSAPLAIETSGHAAFRENYFLDDGAYLITRIIIKAAQLRKEGRTVDSLLAALEDPAESAEVRFAITAPDFQSYGKQVLEGLEAYARQQGWQVADDSAEGVRIQFEKDWFLLRLSVHDPVMPLNIESAVPGGCRRLAARLAPYIRQQTALDTAKFDAYLQQ